MKKKIILVVFLLLILVACLIGGNYLGGYAALKYSGLSIDMLQWNTFNNVITQFSGKPEYKKLVAITWAGFAAPCAIFIGFVVIVIAGLMPKKVIYGNARLATDMDLAKSTFFPTRLKSNVSTLKIKFKYLPSYSLSTKALSIPILFIFSSKLLGISEKLRTCNSYLCPDSFTPSEAYL